ncbi:MAG: hypothetical protein L0Y57_05425 [Beijerinckiaceae bacterium]|nr:hypothetical protein [Beijerinckiaceae bacterium]
MNKSLLLVLMTIAFSFTLSARAGANCIEEPRKVSLDDETVALLKSYKCSVEQQAGAANVRMEFYRLSGDAAGLVIARGSSKQLKKAIGSPKVLQNEVARTYGDLTKKFGITKEVSKDIEGYAPNFSLTTDTSKSTTDSSKSAGDDFGLQKYRYRQIGNQGSTSFDYPAVDEIMSLRKKLVPENLNYYYSVGGTCESYAEDFLCTRFLNDIVEMKFWRPMQAEDVINYVENTTSYNTQLMKIRKDVEAAKGDIMQADVPNDLKLMAHVAPDSWPDDLLILTGQYATVSCGDSPDLPGLDGWSFTYVPRGVALDVMLLENVSRQPIMVDALVGERAANTQLRPIASKEEVTRDSNPLEQISETLAPGARILVPTRIVFLAPKEWKEEFGEYKKSTAEFHELLGAKAFPGNADAYRVPQIKDYAYGPELSIDGAVINQTRAYLGTRRSANFIDLTIMSESGSCPYLLSWDDKDHEWVEHGKVLHEAPAKDREYSEARTFEGLRTRFRIEEREPEIARINGAKLILKLNNGDQVELMPANGDLSRQNSASADLLWGERVDIDFILPGKIRKEQVVESRLEITGYYERYSRLMVPSVFESRSNAKSSHARIIDHDAFLEMEKRVSLKDSQSKSVKSFGVDPLEIRN